jgi:subtilisin family serine protease
VFVTFIMAATAIPAAASTPPQATSTPPLPTTTGQAGASITLNGVAPGPHTVHLITGDSVTLLPVGGGYSIDLQPTANAAGRSPQFLTQTGPDGVYVFPDDALPAVLAGSLDRELFNVKYLAENRYDEASQIPVIVQYGSARSAASAKSAAEALPASTPTRELSSIHGAALNVPKEQAATFWKTVRGAAPAAGRALTAPLGAGVAKVWLDGKVRASLDVSVPLIGAPDAWAAGYDGSGVEVAILDTGIDQNHPDLNGKVVQSQSFVPGVDNVNDSYGHGTHVASILAGSGAAAGGRYKGVAKEARLAIGKVLGDDGFGEDSWIIAGMEWAARSGAKVVNMSLGAGATDGTDPLSQAVNNLTAETGTLFVTAAGNSGPGEATVISPGAADAALTVAATDKSDKLADFSSRGPRSGDGALKPDIAAPGVDIVAASANNDDNVICLGEPSACDGTGYMRISGTSMATPHVAGAAAILAQQHPDWKAPQLKAALMSTAKDDGFTVYQQGAGRVDVSRAVSQQVYATTTNVDFGVLSLGPNSEPIDKAVSYTNLTNQPVTLTLSPQLRTVDGKPATEGALTVDSATLTVPASGTAAATVTLDPAHLAKGQYTGAIVATAGNVRLTTPVGLSNLVKLTIHVVHDRAFSGYLDLLAVEIANGQAANSRASSAVSTRRLSTIQGTAAGNQPGAASVFEAAVSTFVLPGTYSATAFPDWAAEDGKHSYATVPDPQISVTGDTEVTLDARTANEITFTTPRPAQRLWSGMHIIRTGADGYSYGTLVSPTGEIGNGNHILAAPTKRVTKGIFRYSTQTTLANPQLTMTIDKPERRPLNVLTRAYADRGLKFGTLDQGWVPFTKNQTLRLADAGFGDSQDIDGLDLRGKLALLRYGDLHNGIPQCFPLMDRVDNVRQAGAAGVVWFPTNACRVPSFPTDLTEPQTEMSLPEAWLRPAEGEYLAGLAAKGSVRIDITADPNIRYTYELKEWEEQEIPNSLAYTYTSRDLAQFDTAFHASQPQTGNSVWDTFTTGGNPNGTALDPPLSIAVGIEFAVPQVRPVYVGPLSSTTVWTEYSTSDFERWDTGPSRLVDQPIRTDERRGAVPFAPALGSSIDAIHKAYPDLTALDICRLCREGDIFWAVPLYADAVTTVDDYFASVPILDQTQHLYRADGDEIPQTPHGPFDMPAGFTLPPQPGVYRFVDDRALTNETKIDTAWTFTSPGTAKQTAQGGYVCLGRLLSGSTDACQPEPVIFLGYDLGDSLDLDNTVKAPGSSVMHIRAFHNQSTAKMPPIAGLKLWASTDDGAHWKQLPVTQLTRGADATFKATIVYPKFADTTGAVSLKAETWDAAGNRTEQTITRAFNLRNNQPTR